MVEHLDNIDDTLLTEINSGQDAIGAMRLIQGLTS
jgi:hypothetical protein